MTDLYYIMDAHGRRGPFTLAALRQQHLPPDALVSRNAREPWIPAAELPELRYAATITDAPPAGPRVVPQRSPAATAYVTNTFIAANLVVFVAMLATGVHVMNPGGESMLRWGANYWPLTTGGQPWRLFTAAFLHFGIIHLLANMYALVSLGWLVELLLGRGFYAVMYLVSAVVSSAVALWWTPHAVIAGASGAVFAVYGALFGYLAVHHTAFPRRVLGALLQSTLVFVGINVAFGLTHPGISNSAHIGGLVCGAALGALFGRPIEPARRARQTRWRAGVAAAVVALVVGGVAVALPRAARSAPAKEAQFAAERRQIFRQEKLANDAFAELQRQFAAGRMSAEQFAEALEKAVIPHWDSIVTKLELVPVPRGAAARPAYEAMVEYYGNGARAYHALLAALRDGDDAGAVAEFEEGWDRMEAARERFRGLEDGGK